MSKLRYRRLSVLLAALVFSCGCGPLGTAILGGGVWLYYENSTEDESTAPTVSSITPDKGTTNGGTSVTITGSRFQAGATVTFGGNSAMSITVVNATTLTCDTPAGTEGAVDVVVTNPDDQYGTLPGGFTYKEPTITGVSPSAGTASGGTSVTITGTGFQVGATVTFGGNSAMSITVVNATTLTCDTPVGTEGAVDVVVTNPDTNHETLAGGFIYVPSEFSYVGTFNYSCGGQNHDVEEYDYTLPNSTPSTVMRFVLIPDGAFTMGSPTSDPDSYDDERPQHTVTLEPFLLAKYECTQEQWLAVMGSFPQTQDSGQGDDYPVYYVSWDDIRLAGGFCETTSLSLPSESQWEYACRAGTTTRYYFSDESTDLGNYAWFSGNASSTKIVGQKLENAFGLYDMHGNVWEWCEDTWHNDYNGAPPDGSAWLGGSSTRVSRGGGWNYNAQNCRPAFRDRCAPSSRINSLGFRPSRPLR